MPILNYKEIGSGKALFVLHGLFGSLDNWQTFGKLLSESHRVILVDLRNHGRSFHSEEMNFEVMSGDLLELSKQLNIQSFDLLGHSLGGKMAMHFALHHPDKVEKLIIVDVAPFNYVPHHRDVFDALFSVDLETATSRNEIEITIGKQIQDPMVIQFLMKGIQRDDDGKFKWKFNLTTLYKEYSKLIGFVPEGRFDGETLFIRGEKSDYITAEKMGMSPVLFPNFTIETIANAGHWVHAQNPNDFNEVVIQFLSDSL